MTLGIGVTFKGGVNFSCFLKLCESLTPPTLGGGVTYNC